VILYLFIQVLFHAAYDPHLFEYVNLKKYPRGLCLNKILWGTVIWGSKEEKGWPKQYKHMQINAKMIK
jgi:hypothetical protein